MYKLVLRIRWRIEKHSFFYEELIKMHYIIFFSRLILFNMGLMDFLLFKLQNHKKVIYVSPRGIIFKTRNSSTFYIMYSSNAFIYTLSSIMKKIKRINDTTDDYENGIVWLSFLYIFKLC